MRILKPLLIVGTLSACASVGPDYQAPEIDLTNRFVGGGSNNLKQAAQAQWWTGFHDPLLNSLVAKGINQNLDVAASLERIRAARLALGQSGFNAQISGDLDASFTRSGTFPGSGVVDTESASVDARYVFDLFGGVRRGREQAEAILGQAEFEAGTVRLGFLTEITSAYVQARFFQNAAEITRQTIANQSQTLNLVRFRLDAGEATKLEEQQALERLNTFKARLPILVAGFEGQVLRIATLLAEPAQPLLRKMQPGANQPWPRGSVHSGIPADLVRNRPDVRAAERNLAAAVARVGVAEAALYPSLNISGNVSVGTSDTWRLGPALSLPVFNRGVLSSRRDVAASEAKQAELAWRSTALQAIEDVQVALSSLRNTGTRIGALNNVVNSSTALVELSTEAYSGGAAPLTDILDAELSLANNRQSVAEARLDYSLAWIQLQVAAGKGWAPVK